MLQQGIEEKKDSEAKGLIDLGKQLNVLPEFLSGNAHFLRRTDCLSQ